MAISKKRRKNPQGQMPIAEHLLELKSRIIKIAIIILLGAIGGWFLYDYVLAGLLNPIVKIAHAREAAGKPGMISPNFGSVGQPFDLRIKLSIFIGIIASCPLWLYQIWAFITPGLTKKERWYTLGFLFAAVPLFVGGSYLAYLFIPNMVAFLVSFTPSSASTIFEVTGYLSLVTRTILAFGFSFLVPLILVGLNFIGILSARSIIKAWRWVVVVSFTFAAIATPTPDVYSMFLLALPLLGLFGIAIVICLASDKARARRQARRDANDDELDDDSWYSEPVNP